jgi:hypothetical protein
MIADVGHIVGPSRSAVTRMLLDVRKGCYRLRQAEEAHRQGKRHDRTVRCDPQSFCHGIATPNDSYLMRLQCVHWHADRQRFELPMQC